MLDVPGGTYWEHWGTFIERELERPGYVSPTTTAFCVTDSVETAVDEILELLRATTTRNGS